MIQQEVEKERVLSVTQVETFSDCQRKWAWDKLDRVPRQQNASAALGTEVHSILERYLKGRGWDFRTEAGYIAQTGLPHLPEPMTYGMSLEEHFKMRTPGGHLFQGYIDCFLQFTADSESPPIIIDHKTSSNIELYGKTEESLRKDFQANLYAYYAMQKLHVDEVELRWIYYQTKKTKKSKRVSLTVVRDEVERRVQAIDAIADEIKDVYERGITTALDLPPSPEACEKYGGCPYRHLCNLSPEQKGKSIMGQDTGSNDTFQELLAKLATMKPAPAAVAAPVAAPVVVAAVNPPEFQPPPARVVEVKDTGVVVSNAVLDLPAPTPAPAEPEGAKATKRGRPKKLQTATAEDVLAAAKEAQARAKEEVKELQSVQEVEIAPGLYTKPAEGGGHILYVDASKIPPVKRGYTLYINCAPLNKNSALMFETLAGEANEFIKTSRKVEDYRLLPFGEANAAMAMAVEKLLPKFLEEYGAIIMNTHAQEAQPCLAYLTANADEVIRGF